MADPTLQYGTTPYSAMDPRPNFARTDLQSAAGLGAFGPSPTRVTLADIEVEQQQALDRIAGLGVDAAPRLRPPPEASKQMAPGPGIYYSPGLDRFAVGDIEFGRQDYDIALQAAPLAGRRTGRPTTPGDWQEISPSRFGEYISSISEGRGLVGNIGVGIRQTGESLVGGVGRGLQMAGLEAPGEALVELGEAIGLSPAEEARSAAISAQQGLPGKIGTAMLQSGPTLATAIGAGLAGAAVGGPVGALAGVALSILPMELQSSWEAAEANPDLDVTDSGVQGEILAAALGKTAAQTFGAAWLARGLSPAFRQVLGDVAGKSLGSRITRGVGAGAVEGLAETAAVLVDRVAFDPELRALMTEGDWMAIAPAFAQKYGEEALIAFGAGFLLGAPLGAISSPDAQPDTPPPPQRKVDTDEPVDVLSGATLGPQAAPGTQGEFFPGMDLGQTPAEPIILAPEQRVGRQLELPFPEAAAPVETQLELPLQAPVGAQGDLFGAAPPLPQQRTGQPFTGPLSYDEYQALPRADKLRYVQEVGLPPLPPMPPAPPPTPAPAAPPIPQAAPAAPPLLLTPEQQANIQETRAAERQAGVEAWNRVIDNAQAVATARARGRRDLLRQRNIESAARRGAAADADVDAQAAQASAARRLASAARQETAAAQGAAADARIEEALATQGTPAARILYGNLIRAERRVAAADEAFRAARTSGDPVRIQQAGAELVDAQAALARLRARNEEDALPEPPVRGEPEAAPRPRPEPRPEPKPEPEPVRVRRQRAEPPTVIAPKAAPAPEPELGVGKLPDLQGTPTPRPETPTTPPVSKGRVEARNRALAEARKTNKAVAVEARAVKPDPVSPPEHEVAMPDGTIRTISRTDNMGIFGWFDNETGDFLADKKAEAIIQLTNKFITPPTPPKGPPPKGSKPKPTPAEQAAAKRARQKKAATKVKKPKGETGAVQEPSPKESTLRQEPEARPRVRAEDTQGQEAAGTREVQAEEVVATEYPPLAGPRSEAFGTFNRIRYKRRGDQYIEERRIDEVDGGRIQKPGTWKYSSTLLTKEQADARYAKRQEEGFDRDTAVDLEALPEGPPPRRRQAAAEAQVEEAAATPAVTPAEPEPAPTDPRKRVAAEDLADVGLLIEDIQTTKDDIVAGRALIALIGWSTDGTKAAKERAAEFLAELESDPATARQLQQARLEADLGNRISKTSSDVEKARADVAAGKKNAEAKLAEAEAKLQELRAEVRKVGGAAPSAADNIIETIEQMNAGGIESISAAKLGQLTKWWSEAKKSDPQYNGRPLADYIKGDLAFFNYGPRVNGRKQIVPKDTGRTSRTTFNFTGGKFNNLDGSPVTRALPHGRAKMLISGFRKKLKRAPSIKTFTNVAQLKSKAPDLYARAAAARAQGDFDNVTAAGYSFGDGEVIIFTDNVANEAHLRFVLAHETMGHYGLRGFIPAADFDKTMESIYDEFPHIQGPVDAAMARVEGLSKAEAVEEYLSDYAALLETNLLLRVWNAVKNALNALGLKFVDDYPRYLINHARQYARRPGRGHFADMDVIAQRAHGVETGALAPGRYKRSDEIFGTVEGMMSSARLLVGDRSIPKAAEKRVITDLPNTWETAKNEFLSLFPFQARKNPGLKALNEIITDGEQRTQHIRNLLDEEAAPALNNAIKVPGTDFEFGGMTEAETTLMNNALAVARVRAAQRLLDDPKANQSKTPIFTYDETTGTFTETVINPATGETEADRLADLYAITREEFDSEFTATIKRETGEREVRKYMRDPKVTNTDRAWDGYQRLRRAFVEAHKMLLLAKLSANTATMDGALEEIASLMPSNRLTSEQRRLIRKASQLYSDLYNKGVGVDTRTGQMQTDPEAIRQAEEFLQAFNTAIIADKSADADTDLSDKNSAASRNKNLRDIIVKVASKQEADDIVASVENFKDAIRVEVTGKPGKFVSGLRKDQYLIQQKIASLNTAQFTANNGEQSFRYLVASQFTPIIQKGNYQVRIVPVTADGEPVALGDAYGGSVGYTQFATQSEADAFAEAFMAKQVDENGDPLMFDADTKGGAGETVKASIRLEARVDEVQADVLAPTRMGLQEFMMQIAHYSVPLTPEKRQEIMIDATRQDDRARKRLLTEFTPGDPKLGVEAIAKHIEGLASTVAKIEMRPRIERLMSRRNRRSQELWDGDPKRVEATKARYERLMADPGASREQVDAARRDYEEAQMLFDETGGMSNKYKNQAGKLLAFINDNETLTESNFDASAFISTWRTLTAVAQLGLNFVTAALNPAGVYTNVAPYLATRNSKTAFGGGFGMGRTMTEINRAFKQVGLPGTLPTKESAKFNEASFWEGVAADDALQKKYKVTDFEARMLAQEIRRGSMQPTLTNSLVNKSRGLASTAIGRKVADGMMFMFNVSEQASRRAAGLAAFRMEFARRVAAIDPDLKGADYEVAVEQVYRESTKFVREMLDLTIGNYATSKRPNFFRGGWPGILYMYKVFPTTSIQLFRNMDAKGKMWMLASLWALGGIAAWPFAEEIEDLLDTLDQKFGLGVGTGSIRAFVAQQFDQIQPGLGQLLITGGFGQFLPLDVASRVSLSAIPGTELFLAGTDRARMYEEIAGPMPSALFGAGAAILDAVRAPFSTTITMEDVAREAPVTAIRLLADSYAYLNSGAIIDRRGYVVEPDLAWYDIAARIAGGYPISAAEKYGAIRIINRVANYRRELSAQYRSEWVQASIRGDVARRREIEDDVREWNRTHRGTPLEITNFRQGAQRALREARRPATERTLRTTPTAGRSEFEDIIDALTR